MSAVLVTGSGRRLGGVIARDLAAHGFTPILHYNQSAAGAAQLAAELGTHAICADLGDADATARLIGEASAAAGCPLTALINSASIFEFDHPGAVDPALMARHYQINTIAPAVLAQHFAAQAQTGDDPVIVNLLDQKLWNPNPDFYGYTLSKAALHAATDLMARSYAPKVRVLGVAPGYNLPSPTESEEAFLAKAATVNALGRRLDPRDVAETVRVCLTTKALTGQTLIASNGEHLIPSARDVVFSESPT